MKSGIYKIICFITLDFYIGSSVNLSNRKIRHFVELRKNKHPNQKLQNSFNKHGEENFIFEILECCEKENLISREQYYFDTLKPKYNILKTAGSSLGVTAWNKGILWSEEVKEKNRLSKIGKKQSQETINKRLNTIKLNGGFNHSKEFKNFLSITRSREGNSFYGKHHTEENKLKHGILVGKVVIQRDLQGNFIKEWHSAKFAMDSTGIRTIRATCRGITKQSGGFKWEYKNNYL